MPAQFARVIAPPAFEDHHLGSAAVLHHFGGHGGSGDIGSANLAAGATNHQNLLQLHFAAGGSRELFHNNSGTFFDAVLFAARFDNRVHGVTSEKRKVYLPQARKNVKCYVTRPMRGRERLIYPGVGYGGSCFPKDVKALIHTAETSGVEPMLLNAVEAVNARQKRHMADRIQEYFAPQGGVKGKTLAVWGLAFKANTDDMREAAAISIISLLTAEGMKIRAFDPIAAGNARQIFHDNPLVEIMEDQYAVCDGSQALLVVTEWNQFRNPDFERIKNLLQAPILFDGRNLYAPAAMADRGFAYFCIGRKSDM